MTDVDNFGLSENAIKQFDDLYSLKNETIAKTFMRVAKEYATDDKELDTAYGLLADGVWRPNTPAFLNAGKPKGKKIMSACYIVGLQDSMDSIYDVANVARKIFQYGAGVGIPIGNLRESDSWIYEGARTESSDNDELIPEGKSSGPITFMKLFDAVGETTKSGGRVRRAAILCSMPIWHPDIEEFIACKETDGRLSNMNISVSVTDKFMQALEDKVPFSLISPDTGKEVRKIDPLSLWSRLVTMAHKSADPGILFIDTINKWNPLQSTTLIETPNPCGEFTGIPYSSCNLSAINLSKFIKDGKFDWELLYHIAGDVMDLMNNVIDVMDFPDARFADNVMKYRYVGIGPMGLADALCMLNYRYNGPEGRKFAGDVMKVITAACIEKSADLAEEFGPFYEYDLHKNNMETIIRQHINGINDIFTTEIESVIMNKVIKNGVRNCQFTTCMPTGTTALSADTSYGIEPLFGVVFQKNYIDGTKGTIVNPIFAEQMTKAWYPYGLTDKIYENSGSLKGLRGIPKDVREVFVTAHDIKYRDRIDMQASIQESCSSAISSTINLPKETTIDDIDDIYRYSFKKGLKGVTVYIDGTKKNQPVTEAKQISIAEFKRPPKLSSNTFRVETGEGIMYVTIGDHEGKPLEIFIHLGKSGQKLNAFSEALGRVISIAFQRGVPVNDIIDTLFRINSDKQTWFRFDEMDKKPTEILSIPDAISKLLNKYYGDKVYRGELEDELCIKCGNAMMYIEGCLTCTCGYSKCA